MVEVRVVGSGGGTARVVGGRLRVPGDKSITHRALVLAALAPGASVLEGCLDAGDCRATLAALAALGVGVRRRGQDTLVVSGAGTRGLSPPALPIRCANSGTTMRLLAGVLAAQPFDSVLDGSEQLRRRPMARVTDPLAAMGARIASRDGRAPLRITGSRLTGARHHLSIPSAQVKTALLLAGLMADGETVVTEPSPSRDHTERLLRAMGAPLAGGPGEWRIRRPDRPLHPLHLQVPGDPSSAAFLWALAAAGGAARPERGRDREPGGGREPGREGSRVRVDGVGVNPGRTGFLRALERMGARVEVTAERDEGGEPVADVAVVGTGGLAAATFAGDEIVAMIDELPVLAVVATQARGETAVRDAAELRVKESDRIDALVAELTRLGARIRARDDGFVVTGPTPLRGARVHGHGDHRLVMALAVAGALADGETVVEGADCAADSYPGFDTDLRRLGIEARWA
jgi:3-phosphoshikimate 1-carboxyvinyltransferase